MTLDEFLVSVEQDDAPPQDLTSEQKSIWLAGADRWEEAHDIAQDIHTSFGSWMHAHLHLVEGDLGNASYWYSKAGRPSRKPAEIEAEWRELAEAAFAEASGRAQ